MAADFNSNKMPFKKKNQEVPKVGADKHKWIKDNFDWEQVEGEHFATERAKLWVEYADDNKPPEAPPPVTPISVTEEKSDTVTLSKKQLQDLMDGVEKKLEAKFNLPKGSNDISALVEELVEQLNPDMARSRMRREEQIDQSDYLPEPVAFFTYSRRYVIWDDKRYGQPVKTPYNRPFIFINVSTHVTGGVGRNGTQVLHTSVCLVSTKKEVEWLQKHSLYKTVFFESMGETATIIDRHFALKMQEGLAEISSLTEYEIMKRAIDAGVSPSKDLSAMRSALIVKIAQRNMTAEKNISAQALEAEVLSREKRPAGGVRVMSY